MIKTRISILFFLALTVASCHTVYRPQTAVYYDYRISSDAPRDSTLQVLIQPYASSLDKSMNEVIGEMGERLEKKQPDTPLGDFMADAMLVMARKKFGGQVDLAVMNYGGIRLTDIPAGPVTRGKIYELMPFDNLLVLQRVKGSVLRAFIDHTTRAGGWPFSGLTLQIRDKKAINIMIGGEPLDPDRIYLLANSDYIANGGDRVDMLRSIPQIDKGYLLRDAIIDYIQQFTAAGKKVYLAEKDRITYAE